MKGDFIADFRPSMEGDRPRSKPHRRLHDMGIQTSRMPLSQEERERWRVYIRSLEELNQKHAIQS